MTAAPEAPRAQIIDLMEALKASLANKTAKAEAAAEPAKTGEPEPEAATGTDGKPVKRALRVASSRGPARRSRGK